MDEYFSAMTGITGLRHVISTRLGGVSAGGYGTLNLGYHVGDDPACVSENRRRLAARAGYDPARIVAAQQVHGARVARVTAADAGRGAFGWDDALPETDAMIVVDPDIPVMVQVADCAPVLIVDPARRALAVVHAGWRGALARIASAAVAALGGDPRGMSAGIGPALCAACLEVGDEVADQVRGVFGDGVIARGAGKPHLDLPGMIVEDLVTAGLDATRVVTHPDCPRCRVARYFSHRGQGGQAGRIALVAWWDGAVRY